MAGLRKLRGKYYARVHSAKNGKNNEKLVPLRTDSKVEARVRLQQVVKLESDIKEGIGYTFPWMNKSGELTVKVLTIQECIDEYLKYLKGNGCRSTTINRAYYCLRHCTKVLGKGFPIENISSADIERIKTQYKGILKDNGINIVLTRIRAFLNWCHDIKGVIDTTPIVKMIRVPYKLPSYLSESDQAEILRLEWLAEHYKQVFRFYWETGCRLREPFNGKISGSWLVIDSDKSKTGIPREIYLKPHQIEIVEELHERHQNTKSTDRGFTNSYSRYFKKACIEIGREDLHFHNLRDTFAVMRYLETRDIYQVSKELGHTSVKVTEKYARFRLRRLEQDFPSLSLGYNENGRKNNVPDTEKRDTAVENAVFIDGK